jgi:hypothetical protein
VIIALVETLLLRLSPTPHPLEMRHYACRLVCARLRNHPVLQQNRNYSQPDRNPPPASAT